ncbi:uncharacterized protein LOC100876775 [Megachile rotundata]|uniref:uncharacterized protein LOC100876775 n=1 Tax=Megachile rotundata TaxID=143995 RepID=UPI000614E67A|nr:PREDICTED: uncharacterized protein LOC100876775 [Megachile rotundata]
METYKIIQNIINSENDCEANNESASELKNKLKKQTEQLKSIIYEMECSLGVTRFSNANCIIDSQTPKSTTSGKIPNVDIKLKSELYKYSGFYCTKCTKHEYVFHFSSSNHYDKKNNFGVQLFKKRDKVTLGKWVMPMPINLSALMSELSINHVAHVPNFLKKCKYYIDCYFIRHKQFSVLMDTVSRIKNCKLQSNDGCTQVILELLGVHDKPNDEYMHIILYLIYHIDTIKPYKIIVDSKETLSPTSKKYLKASVNCFKQFDLHIAFEKILKKEPFVWSREEDEDSPLDMNNSWDSSSEGYLTGLLSSNEKSLELSKRKRKIKKKEKTIKRKKTLNPSYSASTSIANANSISFQKEAEEEEEKEEEEFKNGKTHSLSKRDSNVTELTPPVNKLNQKKLKQRKLVFNNDKLYLSKKNDVASSEITPTKKKMVHKIKNKPVTSTPVHRNRLSTNLPTSSSTDISDITVNQDNLQNMENNINIKSPKSSKLKKGKQSQNNMPTKLLRDRIKKNIKSSKSKVLK